MWLQSAQNNRAVVFFGRCLPDKKPCDTETEGVMVRHIYGKCGCDVPVSSPAEENLWEEPQHQDVFHSAGAASALFEVAFFFFFPL